MSFNSLMKKSFEVSNIKLLMQFKFLHVKTQVESHWMPESGITLHQVMFLHIKFYCTDASSFYFKLPEWIPKRKEVVNLKNKH